MKFNPYDIDLPVREIIASVRKNLNSHNTLIVSAPAGAGKSTLLPLALMQESWLQGKKILMLEPRRLAARSIAYRMADLLQEKVGETVGYRIRFDQQVSTKTVIEVLTEGILTRMIHQDNALEEVGMVIFDEFHERSLHAEVAMALCRESQQVLRQDLRILVMSATLDMPQLSQLLQAPVVESGTKQYPVDVIYTSQSDLQLLPELTASSVHKASKNHQGDVLVFLPGEAEIRKCEELLQKDLKGFAIHPLYGMLPPAVQYRAMIPNRQGKRKIVLATSIAETSLTIEGVNIVVDSGYTRTSKFDPGSGLSRLETVQISKDAADQRAGRAGRLSPGVCYRMWSLATQARLAEHRTPEILEADLASLVLDMAKWGVVDIRQMTWLTPPPQVNINQALDLLDQLEALENGRITPHGQQIHQLPCHPRLAHMLIMAEKDDLLSLATDLAALLEERDPLPRETGIDINLRIEALRRYRKGIISGKRFGKIEKVAASYRKMFGIDPDNGLVDPYQTGILLTQAYPERIAFARPGNNAQFQLANGKYAMASHKDDLAHESWLAVAHMDAREGLGKIFLAAPLNPKDLLPMVKEQEVIRWDSGKGGLIANRELKIGSLVLQSKPLPEPDPVHLLNAITEAIQKEGEDLLDFNQAVQQWQNRVLSLRKWNPVQDWPDVSTPTLLLTNQEWLRPYLDQVKKPEDLKKIDLLQVLHHSLEWEKQQQLDQLAPLRLEVPSGSFLKLNYFADGAPPVLAVRLQEVFGMEQTPRINDDRTPVLLHLLSPGFKPVQVTADLSSFWNNTYFEVKKELKRRYPKHAWPDNPWVATPVKGVRPKNENR